MNRRSVSMARLVEAAVNASPETLTTTHDRLEASGLGISGQPNRPKPKPAALPVMVTAQQLFNS